MSHLEKAQASDDDRNSLEGHVTRNLFRTDSDSDSDSPAEDLDSQQVRLPSEENECGGSKTPATVIRLYMHVLIEQKSIGGSIAEKLWPAASYLASFVLNVQSGCFPADNQNGALLFRIEQLLNSAPALSVIELGAGVGLTGLELATQMQCKFLLTDLSSGLPLLRRNIELNRDRFLLGRDAAHVQKLEWNVEEDALEALKWCEKQALSADQPLLLLGSDCVYWEDLHAPLEQTLFCVLSKAPTGSICLLAGMRRWKRDNSFYQSLGKRSRTDTHTLQCICLQETVSRANGEREVMRVYAVQYVARQTKTDLT